MAGPRALLPKLALLLASLLACLAAIEGAARAIAARGAATPAHPIAGYHAELGWDKPPGGEQRIARDEYDVTISINAKGLRGPDRPYAKPPGTRRILILGDSFAEGYYVEEPATARAVLERSLGAGSACQRYQVINGGTAGYSTDQETLFYEREGYKYQPDLVVVFFYYNDLYYNTTGVGTGGKPKSYFDVVDGRLALRNVPVPKLPGDDSRVGGVRPWRGSIALRLLSDRTARTSPRLNELLARLGLVEPASREPFREFWPYGVKHPEAADDMWRRTEAILRALRASVEGHGGRLVILYVPPRFEVSPEAREDAAREMGKASLDRIRDRLAETCWRLGVPLVDPREALRRSEAGGRLAYFPKDGHWNETGNAVVASELLALVKDLLPCPAAPAPPQSAPSPPPAPR